MSSLIGALRVSLSADTANFEAGMARSRKTAATSAASIERSLNTVKSAASGFAAAFAIGALKEVVMRALEYAGSLAEVAQQLGVTSRDLQIFRYAAGQVGVSQEQLETGLSKLTITLGKVAAGATAPTKALQAIGLSAKDVAGLDAGAAFRKIADGLQPIGDRAQRAAIEVALFGKAGSSLDNLLSGGSGAINELGAAAEKLGIVLSDEQIQHADDTADKLKAVKTVLEANIAGIVADNAGAILGLSSALAKLTGEIIHFLGSNPTLALGIIGALAGGRIGGAYGAVAGGVAGALAGRQIEHANEDDNMDLRFRMQKVRDAKANWQSSSSGGPAMAVGGIQVAGGNNRGPAEDELRRQTALLVKATKLANTPKASQGGKSIPQFLGPNAPKVKAPRSGRTPRAPKDYSDRYDQQFEQDQLRNQKEILAAQRDLATSTDERARLSLEIIKLEHDEEASKIAYEQSQGKLTDAQAAKLNAQNDSLTALRRQAVSEEAAAQKAEDAERMSETTFGIRRAELEARSNLATTADERRKIELELLDLAYQERKTALEKIAAGKDLAAADRARAELAAMPAQYALDKKGVEKSTQGPMQSFLDGIPHTTDQINEAMQSLEVQGINGVVDALSHVGEGWKAMRDIALSAIKDILAQLIRLQLMKAAFNILGGATGSLGGSIGSDFLGSGGGMDVGAVSSTLGGGGGSLDLSWLPKFATGGGFNVMGNHGVDQNTLSLNGLPIARVSHGERVNVSNDNGPSMMGRRVNQTINISTPDADSFRRSDRQIAQTAKRRLASV